MRITDSSQPTAVIGIHGYNVTDPRRTVAKFRQPFESLDCVFESYAYGYWPFPWQITRRNPQFAREVAERCRYWHEEGYRVLVVGHSNGNAIARLAEQQRGAHIDGVLAVNPALRTNLAVSKYARCVLVVHNQADTAVVAGGLLGRLVRWVLPKTWTVRPWGEMGQEGYQGRLSNHYNIDSINDAPAGYEAPGHGGVFKAGKADYWLPLLAQQLYDCAR